jgi:hypothetical protein
MSDLATRLLPGLREAAVEGLHKCDCDRSRTGTAKGGRARVVARVLRRIDDQAAVFQSIIGATRDLVLVSCTLRKAAPGGIVPAVHMLGIAPLVMKEVAANLVRIAKEVCRKPTVILGHCGTCIGVPERIPVAVGIGGFRIKPELGGIGIRFLQVSIV